MTVDKDKDEPGYEDMRRLVNAIGEANDAANQLANKGYEVEYELIDHSTIDMPHRPYLEVKIKKRVYP